MTSPADPDTPSFGTFAPTPWQAFWLSLARGWGTRAPGRLMASLARRVIVPGLRGALDVQTWGVRMRLDPRANVAEKRVLFAPSRFDPAEREALAAHLRPGDVFVDVGANVGMYSLWAGRCVGPGGLVLALEPQPRVLDRLRAHAAMNPGLPLRILPVAAGARAEVLRLSLPDNAGEASLSGGSDREGIDVPVRPLLDLVREAGAARIDALKIDVEGFEEQVLLPFFATAPQSLWPRLIVLERGEEDWAGDLVGALRAYGYRIEASTRMNHILRLNEDLTAANDAHRS